MFRKLLERNRWRRRRRREKQSSRRWNPKQSEKASFETGPGMTHMLEFTDKYFKSTHKHDEGLKEMSEFMPNLHRKLTLKINTVLKY